MLNTIVEEKFSFRFLLIVSFGFFGYLILIYLLSSPIDACDRLNNEMRDSGDRVTKEFNFLCILNIFPIMAH
jgi:hypothetical protein